MRNTSQADIPLAAIAGGIVWVALLGLSVAGQFPLTLIQLIFLLAPLVIIPLGLRIVLPYQRTDGYNVLYEWLRKVQPVGAALAVASFCFAPGYRAALLAAGWFMVCGLAGLYGLIRLGRSGFDSAGQICLSVGLIYLPVGGVGLVASRLGWGMMDFKEPIVLLTAVHFHYAGFAAPLLVGATGRAVKPAARVLQNMLRIAAWGVIVTPGLVAIGFVASPLVKDLSALILTGSLTALSVLTLEVLPSVTPRMARWLLAISALSIPVAMMLVCVYAVGDYTGHELISIPQMAVFHGLTNSMGFGLCGLLAWSMVAREQSVAAAASSMNTFAIPLEGRLS